MIYRVLADGIDILGSEASETLISPTLDTELNSAGEFEFTLPPDHPAYDDVKLMQTLIEIYEDGDLIFIGRPSEINIDWFKQKKVICEGVLSYMNDTVVRPHNFDGTLISDVFRHIVAEHNSQVDSSRQFVIGNITITDRYVYTSIDYDNCFTVLKGICIDTTGGYLFVRKGDNDVLYLDWLAEVPYTNDQPVQFGSNLLDLTQDIRAEDICTVVLPLGAQIDGVNLTIASVNEGSDILEDTDAIAVYGRITRVQSWTDIQDAQSLKEKAQRWLTEEQYDKLSIEVNAAELHYFDGSVGAYKLGQMVDVISGPHGIDKQYPIIKMSISLDSGTKQVTLGTPPRQELTSLDILTTNAGSGYSSSSGGGGGGGSSSGVRDVLVNGSSVVSDHVARVSVPTDTVTASQMNTAINNAVSPKANTADVNASLDLKANTSDVNTALALKADSSDVTAALATKANLSDIINVVANPSGTATDDLETIQIGNVVYDISGGSSSDGQKFVCDIIFENSPLPAPQSATSGIVTTYTLNKSIDDYDAVYIVALTGYYSQGNVDNCDSVKGIIFKSDYYSPQTTVLNSSYTDGRWINIKFTDSTSAVTTAWASDRYYCPTLYKIYGIKFASNAVYLPALYSEEEREVGVWTDGKPLYQKSIPFNNESTQDLSIEVTSLNIDRLVNNEISSGVMNPRNQGGSAYMDGSDYLNMYLEYTTAGAAVYVHVRRGSSWSKCPNGYVTICYTKTTDQPGSGTWTPEGQLAHHYSESEKIVGTWIDGSTVYERVITLTASLVTNNQVWTDVQYANSMTDIDHLISCQHLDSTQTYLIDRYGVVNGKLSAASVNSGTVASTGDMYIIRYTKTT